MRINLNPKRGGIKIKGDRDELYALAAALIEAAQEGEGGGHLLTKDGYEQIRIVREPEESRAQA